MTRPLRVAVIGSGPAGVYASDALLKSEREVSIDLFEKMPAPFGLIRYGVAPDHPRIKGIIRSLHKVMDNPNLRLIGNVEIGKDLAIDDLWKFYDAAIIATGAVGDRPMGIPGEDLDGSWGAGEFVGFYDGNPLFERDWDLSAEKVAVIGVGNVGLDIARVLAKTADELHVTEIPDNVYEALKKNQAKEVHVFGRRGPAQAKFTPLELKELDYSDTIEVIVNPEDIDYDEASENARRSSKIVDMVCETLEGYAIRDRQDNPHKLYIHFFESPVEILGEDGKVVGLRTERTELTGDGRVRSTGKTTDWDFGAVYHAVGYKSDPLPDVPFDERTNTIPNEGGRVLVEPKREVPAGEVGDEVNASTNAFVTSLYTTGWVRRGPVGLIGNTKGDANEAVANLLMDSEQGYLNDPVAPEESAIIEELESRGIRYTTWEGWHQLDAAERAAGEAEGRERKKVVEWEDMVRHSRGE